MPWATEAAHALIREFRQLPSFTFQSRVRWTIGNALACIADDRVYEEVVSIATNRDYGIDREMVVVALGRMKNPAVVDVLIKLLKDPVVTLHALEALRMIGSRARLALSHVEAYLDHSDTQIRMEARKTASALRM